MNILDVMGTTLQRVVTAEEKETLRHLNASGMAKINADMIRGVDPEVTMSELCQVFRAFRERRAVVLNGLPTPVLSAVAKFCAERHSSIQNLTVDQLIFFHDCFVLGMWSRLLNTDGELDEKRFELDVCAEHYEFHRLAQDARALSQLTGVTVLPCRLAPTTCATAGPAAAAEAILVPLGISNPEDDGCQNLASQSSQNSSKATKDRRRRVMWLQIAPLASWFEERPAPDGPLQVFSNFVQSEKRAFEFIPGTQVESPDSFQSSPRSSIGSSSQTSAEIEITMSPVGRQSQVTLQKKPSREVRFDCNPPSVDFIVESPILPCRPIVTEKRIGQQSWAGRSSVDQIRCFVSLVFSQVGSVFGRVIHASCHPKPK